MTGKRREDGRACRCDQHDVSCVGLTVGRLSSERVAELAEEIWTASTGRVLPARPIQDPRGSRHPSTRRPRHGSHAAPRLIGCPSCAGRRRSSPTRWPAGCCSPSGRCCASPVVGWRTAGRSRTLQWPPRGALSMSSARERHCRPVASSRPPPAPLRCSARRASRQLGPSRPFARANSTSSARVSSPSFRRMCARWVSTVRTEMKRFLPIS
jgi:hypothetical protein